MNRPARTFRRACACALFAGSLWASAAAANPATVGYECQPTLPAGERITVDFNSGGRSITVTFPNGQSLRLTRARAASGVRYVGGNVEVFERGARPLILNVRGHPSRACRRDGPTGR